MFNYSLFISNYRPTFTITLRLLLTTSSLFLDKTSSSSDERKSYNQNSSEALRSAYRQFRSELNFVQLPPHDQ